MVIGAANSSNNARDNQPENRGSTLNKPGGKAPSCGEGTKGMKSDAQGVSITRITIPIALVLGAMALSWQISRELTEQRLAITANKESAEKAITANRSETEKELRAAADERGRLTRDQQKLVDTMATVTRIVDRLSTIEELRQRNALK